MRLSFRRRPDPSRRVAPRVRPPPSARVQVQLMGRNSLDIVHARDISETGIGVWIPHGFEPAALDSEIELVITLPGQRSFLARGILRHSNDQAQAYFGVEFCGLSDARRDQIRAYVDKHLAV